MKLFCRCRGLFAAFSVTAADGTSRHAVGCQRYFNILLI